MRRHPIMQVLDTTTLKVMILMILNYLILFRVLNYCFGIMGMYWGYWMHSSGGEPKAQSLNSQAKECKASSQKTAEMNKNLWFYIARMMKKAGNKN